MKKLISRNVSRSAKLLASSPENELHRTTNDNNLDKGHLLKNVTQNNAGSERLDNRVLTECSGNANTNSVSKVQNNSDVELLQTGNYQLDDALEDIDIKLPGPFDLCEDEDLSHLAPNITPTYNFAKFADQSRTLQELVKLGVELYKLEKDREIVEMFLSLDFDRDMKPYIQFLHDCGVESENLGWFITRNPRIFKEDMDDLYTRIRYLRAHNFTPEMIKEIVNKHPPWLSFKTVQLDSRLGHFQNTFYLNGYQVRCLTTQCPKLITYDMRRIRYSTFAVKEVMGFDKDETKLVLLKAPRVWIRAKTEVVNTFDYLHNSMELSHAAICKEPQVLLCRRSRLEKRHKFLVQLKKDQYDPTKPLYVSPLTLVRGSDLEFCKNIAKISIHTYNEYLKSC